MGAIRLVVAASRARRLFHALEVVSGEPRALFHVVDRPVVGADLRRRADGFVPDVALLDELLVQLWNRHGPGLAPLPELGGQALAAAVIADGAAAFPRLAARGEDAGRALWRAYVDLAEARARRVPDDGPVGAELEAALRALDGQIRALRGFVPGPLALEGLLRVLVSPPRALLAWLREHPVVFVDVAPPRSPLRREVAAAFLVAVADSGGHALVGVDADAATEESILEAEVGDATRAWRRRLVDLAVAQGSGDLLGAVTPASAAPVVRIHADPHAERRAVAAEIRAHLDGGIPADEVVVAAPDPDQRAALVDALAEVGLPAAASGLPLLDEPIVGALHRALTWSATGAPIGWIGDVADLDADALLAELRAAGVTRGAPAGFAAAVARARARRGEEPACPALDAALPRLNEVAAAFGALDTADAAGFRAAALAVVDQLRLLDRPSVTRRARALAAAMDTLAEVADAAALVSEPEPQLGLFGGPVGGAPRAFGALAARAARALAAGQFAPEPDGPGRVRVVALEDGTRLPARWRFAIGLSDDRFPRTDPADGLLPRGARAALGLAEATGEARDLARAWANAAADGVVVLSWPTRDGDRQRSASPALRGLDTTASTAAAPTRVAPAVTPRRREARHARAADGFSRWDGVIGPWPAPRVVRVTALERFVACPMRWAFGARLGLEAEPDPTPEPSPLERGNAVHAALESFVRDAGTDFPTGAPRAELRRRLAAAARIAFPAIPDEPVAAAYARLERARFLSGLEDDGPDGILAAWLDGEIDAPWPLRPAAVEVDTGPIPAGEAALSGRIDRVDQIGGAWLVTDYKSGRAPDARAVRRGLALQPIVYAEAVARRFGEPVVAAYQELRRPEHVRRRGWVGDPALVATLAGRSAFVPADGAERTAILAWAGDAVARLGRGAFHWTLAEPDEAGCRACPFRGACRIDAARGLRVRTGGREAQRPRVG